MATQESRLIISIDSRNAQKTAEDLSEELSKLTNNGAKADKQVGVLGSSLRNLAGYMAGVVTVGAAISKMDAYTNLQNRLRLVANSQEELNKATQDTFKIAQNARQEWDSVVQVYQRFSDNAKTLGINMQQTAALTDTVAKAVAISGASAQAAEAALTQFGQALGTGVLRGEELNSVMEQTPALAKAIAQGMGITIGQLRTVAAEGKITSEVLVNALAAVADDVDNKFSKTNATVAQSFTQLSNATTQFIGEAGQASGSAQLLSSAISTLAQNLDSVANVAVLGGVALLTKAIVTQTTALYGSVTATLAKRAANAADKQAAIASATAAVNEAKAHLANVQATNAEAQAKYGATAAAARYKLASDAVTQALIAQTTAQTAANGATSIASRGLALVGGPVGALVLGVTALSAGYMYLQGKTEEANQKLEEQAAVAKKTKEELLALEGAQKSSAKTDLATAFEAQNKELEKSSQLIGNLIAEIYSKNTADAETAKILKEVRQGTMTYDDAFKALNKSKADMPDIINRLRDEIDNYELGRQKAQENANAQETLGTKVTLAGNAAQNAVGKINDNSGALDGNAASARDAANAQNEYFKSIQKSATLTATTNKLIEQGFYPDKAKAYAAAALQARAAGNKLTKEQAQLIEYELSENAKLKSSIDSISSAKKTSAKASKDANTQAKKDAQEANRIAEEQASLRESITYKNADRIRQIEIDLQREIADIRKANFSATDTSGFIENAKNRAALETELYRVQLAQQLNDWQDTEQEKLDRKVNINELTIKLDSNMNDELKQQALNSLRDRSNNELALIKLAKEQRIFSANEAMMTEIDAMKERYRLEYAEIEKIADAEEKSALKSALTRSSIRGGTRAGEEMLTTVSYVEQYKSDSQKLEDEVAKREEAMSIAYVAAQEAAKGNNDEMLRIEAEYLTARTELQAEFDAKAAQTRKAEFLGNFDTTANMFNNLSSSFASLTETIKNQSGEQSAEYRKMFEFQKQFATVSAIINGGLAVSQVWADPSLNFYAKIAASIATGVATAANVAMIQSQQPSGFKSGGYTGNMGVNQEAGVVHGQEYVLNAEATRRVGIGTLDAINSGRSLGIQSAPAANNVNLNNINVLDPSLMDQYMRTDAGQQTFINTIASNRSQINRALKR